MSNIIQATLLKFLRFVTLTSTSFVRQVNIIIHRLKSRSHNTTHSYYEELRLQTVLNTFSPGIVAKDADELTQYRAFTKLMPEIYMLRCHHYDFSKISFLLGKCGFTLDVNTVKKYYQEYLIERLDRLTKAFK